MRATNPICRSRPLGGLPLILLASLAALPAAHADSRHQAMAEAMLNMMESMGMFGGNSARDGDPANSEADSGGANPMDMIQGWSSKLPMQVPDWRKMVPETGASGGASASERLQGPWLGRNGERLLVHGERFILHSGPGRWFKGHLKIHGEQIRLRGIEQQQERVFDYSEHQGRLVMRDRQGRLFLFRRPEWMHSATDPQSARGKPTK